MLRITCWKLYWKICMELHSYINNNAKYSLLFWILLYVYDMYYTLNDYKREIVYKQFNILKETYTLVLI